MDHISRVKENRCISMDTVKIFNKMQCHFHDKNPKQINHTGNTLQHNKTHYKSQ